MKLEKPPIPLEPSFFIVVIAAGIQQLPVQSGAPVYANIEFYQSRKVAYTKDEAVKATIDQLKKEKPKLYDHGQKMGGWKITHVDQVTATDMEKLFKERAKQERDDMQKQLELSKNKVLKHIMDNKDVDMYHRAIRDGLLNRYEQAYLHDHILAKDETKLEELVKSPYMP